MVSVAMLSVVMLSVVMVSCYDQFRHAKRCYAVSLW
jgi:hypothetical protein